MGPVDLLSAPIPGQSLTTEPGNAAWERPPQFVDPAIALEFIWEQLTKPRRAHHIGKMLRSGVPAEYIARSVVFAGFASGQWSPDVALAIARPVLYQIAAIGEMQGIKNMKIMNSRSDTVSEAFIDETDLEASPEEPTPAPDVKKGLLD